MGVGHRVGAARHLQHRQVVEHVADRVDLGHVDADIDRVLGQRAALAHPGRTEFRQHPGRPGVTDLRDVTHQPAHGGHESLRADIVRTDDGHLEQAPASGQPVGDVRDERRIPPDLAMALAVGIEHHRPQLDRHPQVPS